MFRLPNYIIPDRVGTALQDVYNEWTTRTVSDNVGMLRTNRIAKVLSSYGVDIINHTPTMPGELFTRTEAPEDASILLKEAKYGWCQLVRKNIRKPLDKHTELPNTTRDINRQEPTNPRDATMPYKVKRHTGVVVPGAMEEGSSRVLSKNMAAQLYVQGCLTLLVGENRQWNVKKLRAAFMMLWRSDPYVDPGQSGLKPAFVGAKRINRHLQSTNHTLTGDTSWQGAISVELKAYGKEVLDKHTTFDVMSMITYWKHVAQENAIWNWGQSLMYAKIWIGLAANPKTGKGYFQPWEDPMTGLGNKVQKVGLPQASTVVMPVGRDEDLEKEETSDEDVEPCVEEDVRQLWIKMGGLSFGAPLTKSGIPSVPGDRLPILDAKAVLMASNLIKEQPSLMLSPEMLSVFNSAMYGSD